MFMSWLSLLPLCAQGEDVASPVNFQELVANLSDEAFAQRIAAQRQLCEIANNHIEDLARAAVVADDETAERIVEVLESIFLRDEGEQGELAELALEALQFSGRSGSVAAGKVLHGNAMLRESRARKAIEALGGEFVYFKPLAQELGQYYFESKFCLLPVRGVGVGFGDPSVLFAIYLHEDWKGTEADLWHLRRLSHQREIVLYTIRGNSVPLNPLFMLARFIRGLSIQERGACLGISSSPDNGRCEVKKVVRGGAADQAGLQTDDVITHLGNIPIRNFPHLVEELTSRESGEEVTLQVQRRAKDNPLAMEVLNVKVTLGTWREIAQSSDLTNPAPRSFGGPLYVLSAEELQTQLLPMSETPILPSLATDDVETTEAAGK